MQERSYEEILEFFQKVLKVEVDGAVKTIKYDLNNVEENNRFASIMKKDEEEKYQFLKQLNQQQVDVLLSILQDSSMFGFYYFFKRLEEGENIEIGERINFELTAVNEETGQRTKLISADPNEEEIYNNFQEWILDNCSEVNNKN